MTLLLELEADVNAVDLEGNTPLMLLRLRYSYLTTFFINYDMLLLFVVFIALGIMHFILVFSLIFFLDSGFQGTSRTNGIGPTSQTPLEVGCP